MRVHLTGGVRIEAGEVLIDGARFPGRLGRLAFAFLAAEHGRPVPREELAEVLWPGDLPATWEKGTSVLVSRIRRLLEEAGMDGRAVLTNVYGCYQLHLPPDSWIDVAAAAEAADEAESALATGRADIAAGHATVAATLTRQEFLPGEDGTWVSTQRSDLQRILVRALDCLIESHMRLGNAGLAVQAARDVVALEPFRESGHVLLMRAHAARGDRAEALRVHEECRRLLSEELGVDPSPATEAVFLEILKSVAAPDERGGSEATAPISAATALDAPAAGGTAALAQASAAARAARPRWPPRRRPSRVQVAVAAAVVLVAGALSAVATRHRAGSAQLPGLVPAAHTAARIADDGSGFALSALVGDRPDGIAVDTQSAWVIDYAGQTLTRIDAATGAILRTQAVGGAPTGIAVGPGAVWVTTAFGLSGGRPGAIQRFDAATGEPSQPFVLGDGVTGVAAGETAVWVTDDVHDRLLRLDPLNGAVVATVAVGRVPGAVAASGGSVWVANALGGTVSRIDAATQATTVTLAIPDPVALALGDSGLWVASATQGTVTRVDAATGGAMATIPVGSEPAGIAITHDAVWVAVGGAGEVARIDPATDQVTARLQVHGHPTAIGAAGDAAWVTVEGS